MDPDELEGLDEPLLPEDDDPELAAAPDDDDELAPDDEGDGALSDVGAPPPRPRGRAAARIEAVNRENRELRERLDRLERRTTQPEGTSAAERERAEAAERERLQYMSADEKAEYFYKKGQQEFGGQLQTMRFQMADQSDASRFEALCARNPTANKYHDEVEAQLQRERAAGNLFIGREGVLKLILGDRALKGQRTAASRQRKEAARGVERERVAPPRTAGRQPPGATTRLSEREQRRKRLENTTF